MPLTSRFGKAVASSRWPLLWRGGVNDQGRREVLRLEIGCSEAETFRPGFLRQLPRRGLCGVPSVIFDYHQELETALHRIAGHFVATLPSALLAPSLGSGRQGRANGKRKLGSYRFRLSAASLGSTAAREDRREIAERIFQNFPTVGRGRIGGFASLSFPEWLPAKICSANSIEGLNPEIKATVLRISFIASPPSSAWSEPGCWSGTTNRPWLEAV